MQSFIGARGVVSSAHDHDTIAARHAVQMFEQRIHYLRAVVTVCLHRTPVAWD